MFGIIYTVFVVFICFVGSIKECHNNIINKENYKNQDGLTYIDSRGKIRLLNNNHIASYHKSHPSCIGDYVLEDLYEHKIIYNFTENTRNKLLKDNFNMAITSNKSTYLYSTDNKKKYPVNGNRFKDLITGEIYVIRKMKNGKYYFMSVKTLKIVRETDYSQKNVVGNNNGFNIDDFNKKQEKNHYNYNYAWNSIMDNFS